MNTRDTTVETAAEGYLRTLAANGVSYVFGSPGSEDVHYWKQFASHDDGLPEYVKCRHEQVAVDMARGYAHVTGECQCVKLHGVLGTLNGALGIWGAYYAQTPMTILSSHVRDHTRGTGQYQLDFRHPGGHEQVMAPFTKWSDAIATNDEAGRYLSRAVALAEQPPAGPTFLNVPKCLPSESPERFTVAKRSPTAKPSASEATMVRVAETLEQSENPVAVVSDLGAGDDGRTALVEVARRVGMAVFEAPKTRYTFPMNDRLYQGNTAYGVGGSTPPYERAAVDTVLVLGSPLPWYPPQEGSPDATVLHVGSAVVQPRRSQWGYEADLVVEADPATALRDLSATVEDGRATGSIDWSTAHDRWRARWEPSARCSDETVDPIRLARTLDDRLPGDCVIVNETIDHGSIVSNCIMDASDRTFVAAERLTAGGLGSGLGLALGAKLADRDRTVALLLGDGAYHYNPVQAAFGAILEHELPLLVVVFDNGGYRVMERAYEAAYPDGPTYPVDVSPAPDYAAQATAWGFHTETIGDAETVTAAIERAVDAVEDGTSAFVHVTLPDEI